jgi:hypothetical protein
VYYPVGKHLLSVFGRFLLGSCFGFSALHIPNTFEKNLKKILGFYSSLV